MGFGVSSPRTALAVPSLVSEQRPAQLLQRAFTQKIGIPLTGPGKFDDLPGDDPVRKIVRKPEGCSRHFKRDIKNPVGFSINVEVA
jgi:hypothetical protein